MKKWIVFVAAFLTFVVVAGDIAKRPQILESANASTVVNPYRFVTGIPHGPDFYESCDSTVDEQVSGTSTTTGGYTWQTGEGNGTQPQRIAAIDRCRATGVYLPGGCYDHRISDFGLTASGALFKYWTSSSREGSGYESENSITIFDSNGNMYVHAYQHTDEGLRVYMYDDSGTPFLDYYTNDQLWPEGEFLLYVTPTSARVVHDGYDSGYISFRRTTSLANKYIKIDFGCVAGNNSTWENMQSSPL